MHIFTLPRPVICTIIMTSIVYFPLSSLFGQELPADTSSLFSGSGVCAMCHTGSGTVMIENGEDISPVTMWCSAMMAHADKDPLWQAKVTAEIEEHPALQAIIEDKCTTCHAPLGRTQAIFDGADGYTFSEMQESSLALDGVSCTLCHQIQPDNFGETESFSGHYEIEDVREIYGPFTDPLTAPMFSFSAYTPIASEHIHESELCATCHTLYTPYVDNEGNVAGEFPEQTPYLEWLNSDHSETSSCQGCHMPHSENPMDISTMPPWHTVLREPFAKHEFVGGNRYVLSLINDNINLLGITATQALLEATMDRTDVMLQENTIELSSSSEYINESLIVHLSIANLAGHKFPTGIPLRRMWLHITARDVNSEVLFESGEWDADGVILDEDESFETHYNWLTDEDQVQIYEAVMHDVDTERTWTLLRAAGMSKDNRLPPSGFTDQFENYTDIAIVGEAADDPDYNRDGDSQGTGADIIHLRLPPETSSLDVAVVFQTASPAFLTDLFSHDSPEVELFSAITTDTPPIPVQIASMHMEFETGIVHEDPVPVPEQFALSPCYPNPFNNSTMIMIRNPVEQDVHLSLYNSRGQWVKDVRSGHMRAGDCWIQIHGDGLASGVYYCCLRAGSQQYVRRLVLQK